MKKAFNFKKLLVCVLILVLCLSAFIACNDNDDDQEQPYDPNGINMAVNALKVNVKGRNVNADFTLDNHQVYASVSYPITWSVAITEGETSDVTLTVEGDKTVVHVNGKTKTEVKFTLTATITDAQGVVKTVDIKYTIPAYKLLTHAEYMAAKAGEAVTVQGIVSHYGSKSNGATYNNLFMYDNDGSYYIYSIANSVDPANIQGFHLGAKVEISGTKDIYNGTHEVKDATIKVIDSTLTAQFEDITDIFKSAKSVSDAALAAYEYKLVTIKNVTIGEIDDSEKHNYYYFESGNLKTYIRLSTSDCMLNKDQQATFKAAFAADNGKLATVKGCVVLYNGQFYINPVDTTPYTVVNTEGKSAQEQVDFATTNNFAPRVVDGSGTTVDLPAQDSIFSNVKIAWTTTNTDIVKIEGSKATFTFTQNGTVKLTATFTHSEDATATATKDFTVSLNVGTPATVAEVNAASKGTTVYVVTGYVVAAGGDHNTAGSFVLADETGTIFSYEPAKVEVGDYVRVIGTRDEQYNLAQLKTITVEQLTGGTFVEATPEDINVASVLVDGSTLYTNKYYKIVAGTLKVSGKYYNLCNGDTTMVSLYANDALKTQLNALDGKTIVVYGYSRGVNTYNKYWQVQVTKVEEAQMTDAEKVANVKATLKDMEVSKDFDLPTSSLATITWSIKSGTAATLAGNKVTINQTDADQTVIFTATIVSGDATDSIDITVTIKAKTTVQVGVKGEPNVAYKLMVTQENLSKDLFLTGEMSDYYFASSENVDDAIDVYVEVVSEDTYRLYIQKGDDATTKKYIEIIKNGSYTNVKFNATATESVVWAWDAAKETYTTVVGEKTYALGTYGTYNTFSACDTTKSSFYAKLYKEVVVVEKTDAEKVAEIKAGLELATTTTATDFDLPTTDVEGATITWTSNHTEIIAFEGSVAKVTAPADKTVVTLTATITVGEATDTKTFDVTITVTIPEYDVTVGTLENGTLTVTVDGEAFTGGKLQQGKELVIAVDVNEGYEIVEVKVNGTALTVGTDGKYTYTVNDAPVEITATAREIKYATVTVVENENGTLDVKVGDVAVEADKQYRDGTVLTITATANAGYKLVAIKVNGEAITGTTYTIKETDTALEITVEINEIQAMSIADFKASANTTEAKVTGIVTNIDSKATWIQDTEGNALYIYATKLAGVEVGKKVTLTGIKDEYNGLLQLKNPVVVKVEDTTDTIAPAVLDEAAYKALTAIDAGKLVSVNGLVYVSGTATTSNGGSLTFKLGDTNVTVRVEKGDAAALNSAVLGNLKAGDTINLTNVNIGWYKGAQIALSTDTQVEVVWNLTAVSDKTELVVDGTATITATITPAYMAEKVGAITFSTSDDQVLTVDNTNGTVTAVGVGEDAYIIVSVGGKTVNVPIKVKAEESAYTVTYSVTGENGTITSVMAGETAIVSGETTVGADTKITVTVAPTEGYRLESVTVGEGEADTSVAGKTSFELTITADTTFTVAFEEIPAVKVWTKVTDASTLAAGDQVIFVNEANKSEALAQSGKFLSVQKYTDAPQGVLVFTLVAGATDDTFAFKTADGKYLTTSAAKAMYINGTDVNTNSSWTITINSTGNAVITSAVSGCGSIQFNSGSPRFLNYTSSTGVMQLYKLV